MSGFRGQLSTEAFEGLLLRNGEQPVGYWQRIGPCPNTHRNVLTGATPNPDCALCGGTMEVFQEADLAGIIAASPANGKVLLVNALTQRTKTPVELQAGDIQCSYLPGDYEMADGDRLLLATRDRWHMQLLQRDTDRSGSLTDFLRYWPVLAVGAIFGASGVVDPAEYTVSTDERGITWADDATTVAGDQITVRYRYRPQWIVVENSHHRRIEADDGSRFPNKCVLRQWQGLPTDAKEGDL